MGLPQAPAASDTVTIVWPTLVGQEYKLTSVLVWRMIAGRARVFPHAPTRVWLCQRRLLKQSTCFDVTSADEPWLSFKNSSSFSARTTTESVSRWSQ
eukprot:scaffold8382_cov70-Phaeocystis_antarctica.AAC.2